MYTCDIKRMEDKIKTFSKFGDTGLGGITRFSLSPEAIQARNEIKARMTKLGLDFKTDDMGNIYCTLPGSDPNAGIIMSGSHCDSVRQGGNYDGILGVMTAMEAIETI
ncbi:MAG: Zn-dependent hydrolase, partial [Treponema sp.]|nr:Zn-dependent hydrolase [Treponema sp.]